MTLPRVKTIYNDSICWAVPENWLCGKWFWVLFRLPFVRFWIRGVGLHAQIQSHTDPRRERERETTEYSRERDRQSPVPSLSPCTASFAWLWWVASLWQLKPGSSWGCLHSWRAGQPYFSGSLASSWCTSSCSIWRNKQYRSLEGLQAIIRWMRKFVTETQFKKS